MTVQVRVRVRHALSKDDPTMYDKGWKTAIGFDARVETETVCWGTNLHFEPSDSICKSCQQSLQAIRNRATIVLLPRAIPNV